MSNTYNEGYTHEALHTTHVLMETFSQHVMETRCAAEFPDVREQANKAHQAMFDLYQLIGTKFTDSTTELGPLAKQAERRPSNYNRMSMPDQWDIDKNLGILDWDGSSDR